MLKTSWRLYTAALIIRSNKEYSDVQNQAQQAYDEVSRAASYDKFVRKLENVSQRQQTSDVVRSKYEQALSSDGDKILHQPESLQIGATENSDIKLQCS